MKGERMSDLLNPADLIVLAVIAVGMFFGLRRIAASTHGKSCCSDGASGKWATVTYADHTARVRSKRPVDRDTLETAVRGAGYFVMKM